jgi:hypothetical protein
MAHHSSHPSASAAGMTDGKRTLVRCPICKAEAGEIDRGLFDGLGFDCRFHGRSLPLRLPPYLKTDMTSQHLMICEA